MFWNPQSRTVTRGGFRTVATSKMERFVIRVNAWKPLTIITKRSILDVAAALDPPLDPIISLLSKFLILFAMNDKISSFK